MQSSYPAEAVYLFFRIIAIPLLLLSVHKFHVLPSDKSLLLLSGISIVAIVKWPCPMDALHFEHI